MKVLCISNYYPPYFEGGYELSVQESMDYLRSRGHEIHVLCGHKGFPKAHTIYPDFSTPEVHRCLQYIDYIHASALNKHLTEVHNYRTCLRACKIINPDIVYFGNQKAISLAPVLAVQKLNIPRVFDMGDDWMKPYYGPGVKKALYRWIKSTLPCFVGGTVHLSPVISVSHWLAEDLKTLYGADDVHVVPRAVELATSPPKPFTHPIKFLFAGRIDPQKRVHLLIEAARLEKESHPDFCVDVYGDGDPEYFDECRRLIRDHLLNDVFHFKGFKASLRELLPSYHVMIMPTMMKEPFGRVVIEAMAAGLIVIATNAYGPAEIIDNGKDSLLFERGNPQAMAQCIIELLNSPLHNMEDMRNQAMKKIATHYEISLVKNEVEIIMENQITKAKMRFV